MSNIYINSHVQKPPCNTCSLNLLPIIYYQTTSLIGYLYFPALAPNLYLLALATNLYLPVLAPNFYLLALALNLYLPALTPNLYLQAQLGLSLHMPTLSHQFVFTGPGPQFVFTSSDPQFVFTQVCIYRLNPASVCIS